MPKSGIALTCMQNFFDCFSVWLNASERRTFESEPHGQWWPCDYASILWLFQCLTERKWEQQLAFWLPVKRFGHVMALVEFHDRILSFILVQAPDGSTLADRAYRTAWLDWFASVVPILHLSWCNHALYSKGANGNATQKLFDTFVDAGVLAALLPFRRDRRRKKN